jgi:ribosomal protein L29
MYDETETAAPAATDDAPANPQDEALVKKIISRINVDAKHHEKAFKRMRRDMEFARIGATAAWAKANYTANITGRHIKQTVSTLYAKNPKAVARRRARLDFQIWDEDEQSLIAAIQLTQQFQAQMQAMAAATSMGMGMGGNVVPMAGHNGGPPLDPLGAPVMPMIPPEVQQAQAIVADFQAGMQERVLVDKVGKTLVVLFDYFMKEQKPVDFQPAMKQLVRRTATTCVGYVELAFQREYQQNEVVTSQIADVRAQLARIKTLTAEIKDDNGGEDSEAKARELELSVASLSQQEYLLLREGLVFDFPESTRVIPDKRTRNLTGFVGARWITIAYHYTPEEVRGLFGCDLGKGFTPYSQDGTKLAEGEQGTFDFGEDGAAIEGDGLACVYKHYDRQAGLCYYVCDGYKNFLRPPAPPDVYVEDFWPVYALTFNEGEDPDQLFPPSDVSLLIDMQEEYNRSRQGKREHRRAARPRFASRKGAFDDEAKLAFEEALPFSVTEENPQGENFDINKEIQAIQIPGVDPNMYDTGEIMQDVELVVGSSRSAMGATAGGETATGEALAEDSRSLSAGSNVDDLDQFLTVVSRAAGQILLREMSAESVKKIAGRGAVWPELTLEDIAGEVYLEIEAGSTGKPNAAQEIRNWREMLPFLLQMPGIEPTWLARESLRRLDDRLDLTDALAQGIPSIMMMNRTGGTQMGSDPGAAPDQQGGEGGGNGAPAPSTPSGSPAAMGSNRTDLPV